MATRKRTTCAECGKILTGKKSRFCSQTCYIFRKRKRAKAFAQKWRWRFPEKKCEECGKTFKPIREIQYNCSSECGQINARKKLKAKRAKKRKLNIVHPIGHKHKYKTLSEKKVVKKLSKVKEPSLKKFITLTTKADFNPNDKTKAAVLDFLNKGGKIKKLPDSPRAKIPSVNFKYEYGGIDNEFEDLMEDYGYLPISG